MACGRTRTGCTSPLLRIESASSSSAAISNLRRGCQGPELIHSMGMSARPDSCAAGGAAAEWSGVPADWSDDTGTGTAASPRREDRPRPRPRWRATTLRADSSDAADFADVFFCRCIFRRYIFFRGRLWLCFVGFRCFRHVGHLLGAYGSGGFLSGSFCFLTQQFCGQGRIGLGTGTFQIIDQDGLAIGRGFGHTHIARDDRVIHKITKMLADIICHHG